MIRAAGLCVLSAALAHGLQCSSNECDECAGSRKAGDYWCPNCQGQNFSCLAQRQQIAMGKDPAYAGTFNDFGKVNTGFCNLQQPHSHNRSSTLGPRLLTEARVWGGVGLSQAQFGSGGPGSVTPKGDPLDGMASCGMCLEVSAKMAMWNCELTEPDKSNWVDQKVRGRSRGTCRTCR